MKLFFRKSIGAPTYDPGPPAYKQEKYLSDPDRVAEKLSQQHHILTAKFVADRYPRKKNALARMGSVIRVGHATDIPGTRLDTPRGLEAGMLPFNGPIVYHGTLNPWSDRDHRPDPKRFSTWGLMGGRALYATTSPDTAAGYGTPGVYSPSSSQPEIHVFGLPKEMRFKNMPWMSGDPEPRLTLNDRDAIIDWIDHVLAWHGLTRNGPNAKKFLNIRTDTVHKLISEEKLHAVMLRFGRHLRDFAREYRSSHFTEELEKLGPEVRKRFDSSKIGTHNDWIQSEELKSLALAAAGYDGARTTAGKFWGAPPASSPSPDDATEHWYSIFPHAVDMLHHLGSYRGQKEVQGIKAQQEEKGNKT